MAISIFVTVGTSGHFDRLIRALEGFALDNHQAVIFAQIGEDAYAPKHFDFSPLLTQKAFGSRVRKADVVICHGGFGVIGQIMKARKPMIIVPRTGLDVNPKRQNDQRPLAEEMARRYGIRYCLDPEAVAPILEDLLTTLPATVDYGVEPSNIPLIITGFLESKLRLRFKS